MTVDEFLALPDREKDALVAERVMGWVRIKPLPDQEEVLISPEMKFLLDSGKYQWPPEGVKAIGAWEPDFYSSDISAAWEVIEKISFTTLKTVGKFQLICYGWIGFCWEAGWYDQSGGDIKARGRTHMEAICIVALKAVGVIEDLT